MQKSRLFEKDPEMFAIDRIKRERIFRNVDRTAQASGVSSDARRSQKLKDLADEMRALFFWQVEKDIYRNFLKTTRIFYIPSTFESMKN